MIVSMYPIVLMQSLNFSIFSSTKSKNNIKNESNEVKDATTMQRQKISSWLI